MENNQNTNQTKEKKSYQSGDSIFRAKSLARISSPEEISDYVRMSNPGVWMILIAIILLLAGGAVWGVLGSIENKVPAVCVAENGEIACYISEKYISKVEKDMKVTVGGAQEYTVSEIGHNAVEASDILSEYAMHMGDFSNGEWLHVLSLKGDGTPDDGTYSAEVTIESIHPIKFIIG